jgi:hypothetical protein
MPRVVGNQSAARRVEACAHARLYLAMCHAESDPNENRPANALLCRYREPRVGKLGNHLRDGPRLREAGRFCAGQGAGSCRRDDSDTRTQSKSLLCEEGLTSGIKVIPHDQRRAGEDVGIELLAAGELPHCRFIDQEQAGRRLA